MRIVSMLTKLVRLFSAKASVREAAQEYEAEWPTTMKFEDEDDDEDEDDGKGDDEDEKRD